MRKKNGVLMMRKKGRDDGVNHDGEKLKKETSLFEIVLQKLLTKKVNTGN